MQLGDWVEFQIIVSKQSKGPGSTPTTQNMGRVRRGMVIGVRNVYDVVGGNPPQLANPQPVLIVAVSLHRAYRVFPHDATLTNPPTPRRSRQRRVTAPAAQTVVHGNDDDDWHAVDDQALSLLIAEQIGNWITAGQMFTAYDITMALRIANPRLIIKHERVRPLVHEVMASAVVSGLYERESASFNSNQATRYLPIEA
ncbi:MAG TPA: hypothetical protein DEF47_00685 [Herpetosiphon sp.]|uniref:Uncharacterized protein n=1 Tax=Herpetosiphon aurantiacus (strain ATCC 23779 / DSM 785 / 114-95) TaxID=316274 RepID=A9B245_HERA2|nr:hypothetical protein [Herpetosiphon sp.]ABX07395.1 hypothetical protein Haur_4764 [Herpetosiphon aurantiacus DSM 785]HBW48404.1 hypothetical protein [Herpetosiphon sp.]